MAIVDVLNDLAALFDIGYLIDLSRNDHFFMVVIGLLSVGVIVSYAELKYFNHHNYAFLLLGIVLLLGLWSAGLSGRRAYFLSLLSSEVLMILLIITVVALPIPAGTTLLLLFAAILMVGAQWVVYYTLLPAEFARQMADVGVTPQTFEVFPLQLFAASLAACLTRFGPKRHVAVLAGALIATYAANWLGREMFTAISQELWLELMIGAVLVFASLLTLYLGHELMVPAMVATIVLLTLALSLWASHSTGAVSATLSLRLDHFELFYAQFMGACCGIVLERRFAL